MAVVFVGQLAYPYLYDVLIAIGYGLMLPPIAVLHVRHTLVRQSGAFLGTIAAGAALTVGLGGSVNVGLRPAALFILGIWWWTVGKMWTQTGVLPAPLGVVTAALGIVWLAGTVIESVNVLAGGMWTLGQVALGVWLIALGIALTRLRS